MPPTSSVRRTFASLLALSALFLGPRPAAAEPPPAPAAADPAPQGSSPPTLQVAGPPAATAPPATATVATASPVRPPKTKNRWYGWQLLIGYAVADAFIAGGVGLMALRDKEGIPFFVLGSIAHVAAGPIIHLAHRRSAGVVVGAVALDLLMPITGLVIALNTVPGCEPDRTPECDARRGRALGAGATIGAVSAGIIEVSAFSYEPARRGTGASSRFDIAPLVTRHELGLRVAGSF